MRRMVAGLTAAAIGVAAAGLILMDGRPSLAATPAVNPQLDPPAGQPAVRSGQVVTFGGETTPGSMKVSAELLFEAEDGSEFRDPMNVTAQLEIADDGTISGSRTLPSLSGGHDGTVTLSVTALDPNDGQEATGVSNGVPIDLVAPFISDVRLIGTQTVRVRFNEGVHLPTQEELPADWQVAGSFPVGVQSTAPDERTLDLGPGNVQDQDATPEVIYRVGAGLVPGRESYRDDNASNVYSGAHHFTARDLVPPPTPVIDMVAGKAVADPVVANDETPQIDLSGIREGHWGQVYLESNGQAGLQRPGDAFLGEDQANSSETAQITVPDLQDDGTYTFYAIARDEAVCNPEDEPADQVACPNHSDTDAGATVSYRLDRFPPAGLFAASEVDGEVIVGFTEDVVGSNSAANWVVTGGVVNSVSGDGDTRTLDVTGLGASPSVTYAPGDYADAAGNALPGFTLDILDRLPPVVDVTTPAGDMFVAGNSVTIGGTSDRTQQVQIFRDNDRDGQPDGGVLATTGVGGDAWSASVPLLADTANGFVARGIRTEVDPDVMGPYVPLEAVVTQDSQNPEMDIDQPAGAPFAGQEQVDIGWDADDENFADAPGPIRLEYSVDNGATWHLIADSVADDPPYEDWVTPEATTTTARLRATATDKSGRSTSSVSAPFEIDSTPPTFSAVTVDSMHVDVFFSEPTSGFFHEAHWTIDGDPAGGIAPSGNLSDRTKATLEVSGLLGEPIGTKDTPLISYTHPLVPLSRLQDHVGNEMATLSVTAADGILCDITGTNQNDVLEGTNQPEVFCPLAGNDQIMANGGDDVILSGIGNKTVDGGPGNDEINGGPGFDHLVGGTGNDVILGAAGNDAIEGGIGHDVMDAGDGDDSVIGSAGDDLAKAGGGNDAVDGVEGNDHLDGGAGDDVLLGGDDDDTLLGQDGNDRLDGGRGNDLTLGGAGLDVLLGKQGKDKLKGQTQNDKIRGGGGKDMLAGHGGRDKLAGGGGKDKLKGGGGRDKLNGGGGKDKCNGGGGRDRTRRCEGGRP